MAPPRKQPKISDAQAARLGWSPGELRTEADARKALIDRLSWSPGDTEHVAAADGRKRVEGPTPNGGAYALLAYVRLASLEVVPEAEADGAIVTEYDAAGRQVAETVLARPS